MLRMSTLLFLLSVLLWLDVAGQLTDISTLFPECGGIEKKAEAMANKTTTLHTFSKPVRSLTLNCFANEVVSITGGQSPKGKESIDHCSVDSQTNYRYSLVVRATYMDEKGVPQISDFSIRDISTGSLTQLTFRMPVPSVFSIVFTNLATNDRCTLGLHANFDYTENDGPAEDKEADLTPALVAVRPPTVYPQKGGRTLFVLQYLNNVTSDYAWKALVKLVSLNSNCQEFGPGYYMDYTTELPDGYDSLSPPRRYYARVHSFDNSGSYRVCYQANGTATGQELGIVTVFPSNPSYFKLFVLSEDNIIYTHTPLIIMFYGYDLDTRENGDMAKLVDEKDSCQDGAPAGGVSVNTALLPKDNYGPNTTYVFWKLLVRKSGTFKVCYKRRKEEWVQVRDINTVWPKPGSKSNSTPTEFPIPIDPVTKEACPTAPTDGGPWVSYSSLRFTMKQSKHMDVFAKMIMSLFCVPRSAFTVIRMTHNEAGEQVVYLVFACSGVTLQDGRPACDSVERSNYAVALSQINSTLLRDNDIYQIVGSSSIAISDDDPDVSPGLKSFLPVLFICVSALACTGMLVFAVIKYRERRQYFVQFGMDDNSIDDMYAPGMFSANMDEDNRSDTNQYLTPGYDTDKNYTS